MVVSSIQYEYKGLYYYEILNRDHRNPVEQRLIVNNDWFDSHLIESIIFISQLWRHKGAGKASR